MNEHTNCLNCGQPATNPAATICYSCGHNLVPVDVPAAASASKSVVTQIGKWTLLSPARVRNAAADFRSEQIRTQAPPATCRSVVPASRTMLEILLATTLALVTLTAIIRPKTEPTETRGVASAISYATPKDKWELAAGELVDIGADVRPYNADQPNLMEVQLRPGVVLSKTVALATAECAHSILGRCSLITLRDASGKVIAIANQ